MTEQKLQHITLRLDAHHISLNVPRTQEHLYRRAAELLNEKYRFYKKRMQASSAEMLWVYVALDIAVTFCSEAHSKSLEPVEEIIKELNNKILQQIK
jgi:hypothetical protein